MKDLSCCWVPVCLVMAVCLRRRTWKFLNRTWRKWSGFWHSIRYTAQYHNAFDTWESPAVILLHWTTCYTAILNTVPIFPLFLSEVWRVEAQGAGSISVSTVSAFLCCQVWFGHHWGCPQALWLPQKFRWASWFYVSLFCHFIAKHLDTLFKFPSI